MDVAIPEIGSRKPESLNLVVTALVCRSGSNRESNSWLEKIRTGKKFNENLGEEPCDGFHLQGRRCGLSGEMAVAVLLPSFGWKFPRSGSRNGFRSLRGCHVTPPSKFFQNSATFRSPPSALGLPVRVLLPAKRRFTPEFWVRSAIRPYPGFPFAGIRVIRGRLQHSAFPVERQRTAMATMNFLRVSAPLREVWIC